MATAWRGALARSLAMVLVALAGTAGAQTTAMDLVGIGGSDLASGEFFFECSGSPTCTGEFVVVSQDTGCSNPVSVAGTIQLAVPDISKPGPVSGSGTLVAQWATQRNADGTCTPSPGGAATNSITFSGNSDGVTASVTYTVTDTDGKVHQVAGTLVHPSGAYANLQVRGSIAGTADDNGGQVTLAFTCVGAPFCTGTYSGTIRDGDCSNVFDISGAISFTGFDISSGSFAGTVTVQNADTHDIQNADGTCSLGSTTDHSGTYTGTFDGSAGTLSISATTDRGIPFSVPGSFSATGIGSTPPPASTPPFTLTVSSNITATTANATAQVHPPASDVGKTVGVYVFAFAPRSVVVKSVASLAAAKDDASGCVLAQLDPATGQLRATSASGLAPALTATLTAQGQSVTILNNASTPSVAGASFFVGYGADPSTMISNGINANAVQVPGAQQCPAVFPETPGSLSGLWYAGEAESGWGIDFTQRHGVLFVAWYTYDDFGNPKWYVSPACALPSSTATSGRCAGDLYQVTATPLFGIGPAGAPNAPSKAGTLQVDFADPSHATMSFAVGGVSRTVPIQRQLFGAGPVPPTIDYTDLWYAGEQGSGWGMAITHRYNVMFLAWFVYDAGGKPVWYVASDCAVVASGNGCTGALFQVSGPPLGPTFDPTRIRASTAGSVAVTFTDPNNGTINYTVNGVTASKPITRQVF